MNDGISWGMMNEHRSITIQKNESCIYVGHDGTEYICYKKTVTFYLKALKSRFYIFRSFFLTILTGKKLLFMKKASEWNFQSTCNTSDGTDFSRNKSIYSIPWWFGLLIFGWQTPGVVIHLFG